jgi:hypothetical protein
MNAHTYDMIRHETQQRLDHRMHEASTERLARRLHSGTPSAKAAGVRWVLDRVHAGWAARLIHPTARAPMAAPLS